VDETLPAGLAGEDVFRGTRGLRVWRELVERTGVSRDIERLGRGTRGTAYRAGGRVLKITTDASEATGAALIRDQPDPRGHVSRIDAVVKLAGPPVRYAVVQELLDPLGTTGTDADWRALADLWPAWTRTQGYRPIWPADVMAFVRDVKGRGQRHEAWPAFVRWLAELACYLERIGLRYHDFWSHNLMRRGDQYCAIDFGYSASAADHDPTIQTIARQFIRAGRHLIPDLIPAIRSGRAVFA
jgi:hypothetical protein